MISSVFLSFLFSFILEMLFRSHGIFFPCVACCVFYYAAVLGWKRVVFLSMIPALLTAVLRMENFPFELITYPLICALSGLWLKRTEQDSFTMNAIPGVLIALIVILPHLLTVHPGEMLRLLIHLLPSCVLSAILLPVMIIVLDSFAFKFRFPLYSDVKLRTRQDD